MDTKVIKIPKSGLRIRFLKEIINGKPVLSKKEYMIRFTKKGGVEMI